MKINTNALSPKLVMLDDLEEGAIFSFATYTREIATIAHDPIFIKTGPHSYVSLTSGDLTIKANTSIQVVLLNGTLTIEFA